MTRGLISSGRAWFTRVFPGWAGPSEVDDVAVVTIPLAGSGRYSDLNHSVVSAENTVIALLPLVPAGKQWWVPWAESYHDDGALTTQLRLLIRNLGAKEVAVSEVQSCVAQDRCTLRRPIVIPEGYRLCARLTTTAAAAKFIYVSAFYVETPMGEYMPPL